MTTDARIATGADREAVKTCCAASYAGDAVRLLLGESYHPGGLTLTWRLADALGLQPGQRVLDVASGPGASARLLAVEFGVAIDGVDLAEPTVTRAREAVEHAGLTDQVRMHVGDAERLPLPDTTFDALVCECAWCTFPDKAAAAAEFARVLRPGGRVGITDVTIGERGLPSELTTMQAWVACIADARTSTEYIELLAGAGLRTVHTESHDGALTTMIDQIEARLELLRMTAPDQLDATGVDLPGVRYYTELTRRAIAEQRLGYTLLIAEKPADGSREAATESPRRAVR
jgi:hypothetical protein